MKSIGAEFLRQVALPGVNHMRRFSGLVSVGGGGEQDH